MTTETSLLTRTLSLWKVGSDVQGVKRSVYRYLGKDLRPLSKSRLSVQRTFGPVFITNYLLPARKKAGFSLKPVVDQAFWAFLVKKGAPDALAIDQMQRYIDDHPPAPPVPKYVEPRQGFNSLRAELWPLYTKGRNLGFRDLGTYNPNSRLPSGAPSDHAVYPACAFDLGISPATGWANPKARAYFHEVAKDPVCHYVILGGFIFSKERGLHNYSNSYEHAGHVHVSSYR